MGAGTDAARAARLGLPPACLDALAFHRVSSPTVIPARLSSWSIVPTGSSWCHVTAHFEPARPVGPPASAKPVRVQSIWHPDGGLSRHTRSQRNCSGPLRSLRHRLWPFHEHKVHHGPLTMQKIAQPLREDGDSAVLAAVLIIRSKVVVAPWAARRVLDGLRLGANWGLRPGAVALGAPPPAACGDLAPEHFRPSNGSKGHLFHPMTENTPGESPAETGAEPPSPVSFPDRGQPR